MARFQKVRDAVTYVAGSRPIRWVRANPKKSCAIGLALGAAAGWYLTRDSDEDPLHPGSARIPTEEVVSLDYGVDLNRNGTPDQQLSFFLRSKEEVHFFDDALAAGAGDPLLVINKSAYETRRHVASDTDKTFFNDSFAQRLGYAFNDLATRIQQVRDGTGNEDLRLRSSVGSTSLVDILEVLDASGKSLFKMQVRQEAAAMGATSPTVHYTLDHLNLDGADGRVRVKNDAANSIDALLAGGGDVSDAFDLLATTVQGIYAAQEDAVQNQMETAMTRYRGRSGSSIGSGASSAGASLTRPIAPRSK